VNHTKTQPKAKEERPSGEETSRLSTSRGKRMEKIELHQRGKPLVIHMGEDLETKRNK